MASQAESLQALRDDFRHRLEAFYAHLKLAPPYHSIERALTHLTNMVRSLSPEEREAISVDPTKRWALYRQAFVESGLNQKHRGIISGLTVSEQTLDLPHEYQHFLSTFKP